MNFSDQKFKVIQNNKIEINTYVDGKGPLIIFAHGWPESWYSWRYQITYFVDNGFTVAAPDMRGYGKTSKPYQIESYNIMELTSDILAIANHLGEEKFNLVGHDWGAAVAWHTAMRYPDSINQLAILNGPHPKVFERGIWRPSCLLYTSDAADE